MKFDEFGNEVENVKITIHPMDFIEFDIMRVLNILLKKIKDDKPNIYNSFIFKITQKIQKNIKNKNILKELTKLSIKISQFENLNEIHELVLLHINYLIEKTSITEDQLLQNEKLDIPVKEFMTSIYYLFYIHQITLVELLGKDEAIKFYREYVDRFNEEANSIYQKDRYKNLEEMREKDSKWLKINPYGRIRLYSEVKDGRLIRICKNCEKFSALQNTELAQDKELLYNFLCYMHIPLVRVWNGNFELLLEKSLALGDSYCSYVYFDKRNTNDIVQPSEEFLDKIWLEYK